MTAINPQFVPLPVINPDMLPNMRPTIPPTYLQKAAGFPVDAPDEPGIEAAIVAAGANVAPRVTPDHIASLIASEHFFTADEGVYGAEAMNCESVSTPEPRGPLGLLTFCVLVLKNGFTVTGESACASPANFNADIGRRIARENAVEKVWLLEGYLLRQRLHEGGA